MALTRLSASRSKLAVFALLAIAAFSSHAQGRFTVSADGTEVSDPKSGLSWRRCAEGLQWDGKACTGKLLKFTFAGAKKAATEAASTGKTWRVPTRDELVGLVDNTHKKPKIDAEAFPKTPSMPFWAVRPGSTDDLNAWLVSFSNGKVTGNVGQAKFPLRLVRSGA